jgi:hypothetical protein
MPSRHSSERGSAGSTVLSGVTVEIDPALPRSVLCLLGITTFYNSGTKDGNFQ